MVPKEVQDLIPGTSEPVLAYWQRNIEDVMKES